MVLTRLGIKRLSTQHRQLQCTRSLANNYSSPYDLISQLKSIDIDNQSVRNASNESQPIDSIYSNLSQNHQQYLNLLDFNDLNKLISYNRLLKSSLNLFIYDLINNKRFDLNDNDRTHLSQNLLFGLFKGNKYTLNSILLPFNFWKLFDQIYVNQNEVLNDELVPILFHYILMSRRLKSDDYLFNLVRLYIDNVLPSSNHFKPLTPYIIDSSLRSKHSSHPPVIALKLILWLSRINTIESEKLLLDIFRLLNDKGWTESIGMVEPPIGHPNFLKLLTLSNSLNVAIKWGVGDVAIELFLEINKLVNFNDNDNHFSLNLLKDIIFNFNVDGSKFVGEMLTGFLIKLNFKDKHFVEDTFRNLINNNDHQSIFKLYKLIQNDYFPSPFILIGIIRSLADTRKKNTLIKLVKDLLALSNEELFEILPTKFQSQLLIQFTKVFHTDLIKECYQRFRILPNGNVNYDFLNDNKMIMNVIRIFTYHRRHSNKPINEIKANDHFNFANYVFEDYLKDKNPQDFDHSHLNSLARMCLYVGNLSAALAVFRHMLNVNILPDIFDVNVVLLGIASHSPIDAAKLLNHALSRGLKPSSKTYGTIINQAFLNNDEALALKFIRDVDRKSLSKQSFLESIIRHDLNYNKNVTQNLIEMDQNFKFKPSKYILRKALNLSIKNDDNQHNLNDISILIKLCYKYKCLTSDIRYTVILNLIRNSNFFNLSSSSIFVYKTFIENQFNLILPKENIDSMAIFLAVFSHLNDYHRFNLCLNRLDYSHLSIDKISEILIRDNICLPEQSQQKLIHFMNLHIK